jgi:hypothetical protein
VEVGDAAAAPAVETSLDPEEGPAPADDAIDASYQVTAAEFQPTTTESAGNGSPRQDERDRSLTEAAPVASVVVAVDTGLLSIPGAEPQPPVSAEREEPVPAPDPSPELLTPAVSTPPGEVLSIEGTALGLMALRVAELVRVRGSIREDDLATAYASHYDVDHAGRVNLIERHVHSQAELAGLVQAYVEHSQQAGCPAVIAQCRQLDELVDAVA